MCRECRQTPCHPSCPNYQKPIRQLFCSKCREEILDGEEYIENDDGDIRHYECFNYHRELANWLGYDVKTYWSED